MIEIITTKGEKWEFDPESKLLFKNQTVIPSREDYLANNDRNNNNKR
jgi:hypothetical protein